MRLWAIGQNELIYICWGLMDVALLTPVALSLMPWARYWGAGRLMLWLILIMLLSFNLARFMSSLHLPARRQQIVVAIALTLTIFLSLRSLLYTPQSLFDVSWIGQFFAYTREPRNMLWQRDVVLFCLILLMWLRGIQLATRNYTIYRIGLRLRVGGLLLAPLVIWYSSRHLLQDVTPFLFLFFLAALTAVALIRVEEIAQFKPEQNAALSPRWLLTIVLAALLTVFMAGIVAIIISGQTATAVVGFLAPLWLAIRAMVTVALSTLFQLMLPLLMVLGALLLSLSRLLNLLFLQGLALLEERQGENLAAEAPQFEAADPFEFGRNGEIIAVLLAIAAILMVALVLRRLYRQQVIGTSAIDWVEDKAEESEMEDEGFANRILRRLGLLRHLRTVLSIRRIYRQMLRAATASGYPKRDSETPFEYLATLAKAWPENQDKTRLITSAYVRVRYGEVPETQAELDEIRTAWRHLQVIRPLEKAVENQAK